MGTLKQELEYGVLSRVMPDEPVFPLLARDPRAPQHVREWATQAKADISLGRRPASDEVKVREAFRIADRMEEWRIEQDGAWRNGLFGDTK